MMKLNWTILKLRRKIFYQEERYFVKKGEFYE